MVIPSHMQVLHKRVCYSYQLDVDGHPASERHSSMDGRPAAPTIRLPGQSPFRTPRPNPVFDQSTALGTKERL
jgi:hypothetical protein